MSGKYFTGLKNNGNVDFYVIKGVAEELLDYLGYCGRYSFITDKQIPSQMHPGQTASISVNNDIVGIIGKIHPAIEKEDVYVLEINLNKLLNKKVGKMKFKDISKYPSVSKDLAVVVDKNIKADEIAKEIKRVGGNLLKRIEIFDLYEGANIEENKKSIAYSLEFESIDRTLTDDEINEIMNKIVENLEKKLKAELRK